DRPDAISALVLHQVRRRLRRQRPCRSAPFRSGRAGLDRQPAQDQRLAGRCAVYRGHIVTSTYCIIAKRASTQPSATTKALAIASVLRRRASLATLARLASIAWC